MDERAAVAADGDPSTWVAAVVASLPVSVQPGVASGILAAIDGAPGWGHRLDEALDAGARGILVVEPSDAVEFDVDTLSAHAAEKRVPVVLYTRWAQNPMLLSAAEHFRKQAGHAGLLESKNIVQPTARFGNELLAQLALVRAAIDEITIVTPIFSNDHGYSLLGTLAGGMRVTLTATRTLALPETATLRLLTPTGSVKLELPGQATAQPGKAFFTNASGAMQLPTLFETAHRAAWRRLHAEVLQGQTTHDLADFNHDQALAAKVFQATPSRQ